MCVFNSRKSPMKQRNKIIYCIPCLVKHAIFLVVMHWKKMHKKQFCFLFCTLGCFQSSQFRERHCAQYIYILTILYRYLYALTNFVFIGIYSRFCWFNTSFCTRGKGKRRSWMHERVVVKRRYKRSYCVYLYWFSSTFHAKDCITNLQYSVTIALHKMVSVLRLSFIL